MHALTSSLAGRPQPATTFAGAAEAHLDDVHAYLTYMTKNKALAEDLTAETFERALRSWSRFDPRRGSARTWLCQIARSVALDEFRAQERRRRRERTYAELEPREAPEPALGDLSPELRDALDELSASDRELIVLRVVLELDGPTTARLLGISATACSTRLSRALNRLEERIRDARSV